MKMNGNAGHSDSEIECRKNELVIDSGLHKEETSNLTYIKSEDAVCSEEVENNMIIEKEGLVLDARTEVCSSSRTVKANNKSDVFGIRTEIKEEPWYQEVALPKVKCQLEVPSVANLQVHSELKDDTNEDVAAAESARLYTQTFTGAPSATTDLEENSNPEFIGANIDELYGSDTMETSYYNMKSPDKQKQCDKLNWGNSSGKSVNAISKESVSQQNTLKPGILTHKTERPYKCGTCLKSFTQVQNFKQHLKIHEDKRPYQCKVCDKSFNRMGNLKQHLLIHEGKKPYECDICKSSFSRSSHLKLHVLIHEKERPYKCEFCERSFTQMVHLRGHIMIHEGKRPYQCKVCDKSFNRMGNLKQHLLIHEGKNSRPYKCSICEKGFLRFEHLKRHILIHEDKRSYQCDVCEKRFNQKEQLNKHVRICCNQRP